MSDVPAWSALGISVLNSGALIVGTRRRRQRRNAVGPGAEMRAALHAARDDFQHIVAVGGEHARWFLAADRRATDQRLRDLAKRAGDDEMRDLVDAVTAYWIGCWRRAPAPVLRRPDIRSNMMKPQKPDDAASLERLGDMVEVARAGLAAVESALERLNLLERRLP